MISAGAGGEASDCADGSVGGTAAGDDGSVAACCAAGRAGPGEAALAARRRLELCCAGMVSDPRVAYRSGWCPCSR